MAGINRGLRHRTAGGSHEFRHRGGPGGDSCWQWSGRWFISGIIIHCSWSGGWRAYIHCRYSPAYRYSTKSADT